MRPSRSGGSVPFGASTSVPAPILSYDGAGNLNWTWSGEEPPGWKTQNSFDGGATWLDYDDIAPGGRTDDIEFSGRANWRVAFVDNDGNGVAPFSNVITQVP